MPPAETPPPDLSSAFEDAVIGMTLAGVDHRLLRANRAFCEFLGLARDALLARPVDERVHPHDVPGQGRQRARLLAGEADRYRTEKRYIHADGRVLWADFSCALVRDAAGRRLAKRDGARSLDSLRRAGTGAEGIRALLRAAAIA